MLEGKVLTIENVQNYYDVRIHLLKNRIREAIQKNKEYQKGKVPNLLGPPPSPLN